MKTREQSISVSAVRPPKGGLSDSFRVIKIKPVHVQKLAIVYVRQSSLQQVLENRESTARQYALAEYA